MPSCPADKWKLSEEREEGRSWSLRDAADCLPETQRHIPESHNLNFHSCWIFSCI